MDEVTGLRQEGLLSSVPSITGHQGQRAAFVFLPSFLDFLLRWAQAQGKGDKRDEGREGQRKGRREQEAGM